MLNLQHLNVLIILLLVLLNLNS